MERRRSAVARQRGERTDPPSPRTSVPRWLLIPDNRAKVARRPLCSLKSGCRADQPKPDFVPLHVATPPMVGVAPQRFWSRPRSMRLHVATWATTVLSFAIFASDKTLLALAIIGQAVSLVAA